KALLPGSAVERAVERVEQVWQRGVGYARTAVRNVDQHGAAFSARLHDDLSLGGRVLCSVFHQVVQHLANFDRIQPERRQVIGDVQLEPMSPCNVTQPIDDVVEQYFEVLPAFLWPQAASFNARQVEQIAHQVVEVVGLLLNRPGE